MTETLKTLRFFFGAVALASLAMLVGHSLVAAISTAVFLLVVCGPLAYVVAKFPLKQGR